MSKLRSCVSCGGFLSRVAIRCPHCEKSVPEMKASSLKFGAVGTLFGSSAIAVTLMACYGLAPSDYPLPRTDAGDAAGDGEDGGNGDADAGSIPLADAGAD